MHLTCLWTSCWHQRAQGKLMTWMGITLQTECCCARSLWFQKLMGRFIQAACTLSLQYKHIFPKSSVLNCFGPWWNKPMTKRFLEHDTAIHYYFYYLCNQSTMVPQAQPEIPLLQMLYQRRNLTNWQISIFLITVRKQKNKLSRKGGAGGKCS